MTEYFRTMQMEMPNEMLAQEYLESTTFDKLPMSIRKEMLDLIDNLLGDNKSTSLKAKQDILFDMV